MLALNVFVQMGVTSLFRKPVLDNVTTAFTAKASEACAFAIESQVAARTCPI